VKSLGSTLGLTTYSIELSNITIGDLPTSRRGDFFLSIECSNNPPMVTSVAEGIAPKVVHFPEVVTLRVRDHLLAPPVKISVKKVRLVGYRDLCEIELAPTNIIDWCNEGGWLDALNIHTSTPNQIRRFAMKPLVEEAVETPPWIALEFSHAVNDVRGLDGMGDFFSTVRTATWNEHTRVSTVSDLQVGDTKQRYRLVDGEGAQVPEPLESDLSYLTCFSRCLTLLYQALKFATGLAVSSFLVVRFYLWRCYLKYRRITIAKLQGKSFPISTHEMSVIMLNCHAKFDGTATAEGNTTCRPAASEVDKICLDLPTGQPHPRLQVMSDKQSQKLLGFELPTFPCHEGVCELRNQIAPWDLESFALCVFLLIIVCCCCGRMVDSAIMRKTKASARKRGPLADD
jgi:hypothetical protein